MPVLDIVFGFVILLLLFGIYYGIRFEDREFDRLSASMKALDEVFEQTKFLAGRKKL
jgi:hypothetical protein